MSLVSDKAIRNWQSNRLDLSQMALVNIMTLRPFSEKKILLQHLSYSPYIRAICSLYFQKTCKVASGSYC